MLGAKTLIHIAEIVLTYSLTYLLTYLLTYVGARSQDAHTHRRDRLTRRGRRSTGPLPDGCRSTLSTQEPRPTPPRVCYPPERALVRLLRALQERSAKGALTYLLT